MLFVIMCKPYNCKIEFSDPNWCDVCFFMYLTSERATGE